MTKAVIHILDEVNVKIQGLQKQDFLSLVDMFARYAKGFRFNIKYKLGHWDGKIHFFKMDRSGLHAISYVKLLPEIISYIQKSGYSIKMIDDRKHVDLTIPPIDKNYFADRGFLDPDGNPLILGDHQVRGVNALTSESGGIFEAGTGAGKTIVTAALCQLYEDHLNFKCIVIVPTSDLINQTYDELKLYGVDCGRYSGDDKDINHLHVVSTWQALQNNKPLMSMFQVAIVDECHGVTGSTLQEILNDYGSHCFVRLGLTGTLPEEDIDKMAVAVTLGEVVERVEAHELIANGWLAELKLYMYELTEDVRPEYTEFCQNHPELVNETSYSDFKKTMFADFNAEKKYLQKKPQRLSFIAKLIMVPQGNTLVLVPNVEFGKKISKLIPESVFFYGQDSKAVRKQLYSSFNTRNDLIAITTFQLASTGLNIKRIFNLFLIDGGKSYVQIIQSIGRGLRRASDKSKVRVYDVHSDFKYSKQHAASRRKHYKAKKYEFKTKKVDYLGLGS